MSTQKKDNKKKVQEKTKTAEGIRIDNEIKKQEKEADAKLKREIGDRIRDEREKRKLSQEKAIDKDFSDVISYISRLSRIENGEVFPPFQLLVKLHTEWNMDLNELITGVATPGKNLEYPPEVQEAIQTLFNSL